MCMCSGQQDNQTIAYRTGQTNHASAEVSRDFSPMQHCHLSLLLPALQASQALLADKLASVLLNLGLNSVVDR